MVWSTYIGPFLYFILSNRQIVSDMLLQLMEMVELKYLSAFLHVEFDV